MSEDEGTNAAREADAADEAGVEPEAADAAASDRDSESVMADRDSEAASDRDSESAASDRDSESAPESETPETSADIRRLLDRIGEHDDDLAREVRSVVETARDLNATATDQREELADLRERVETQAETIEELQAALDDREDDLEAAEERADELESRLKRAQADFQNYKKRAKKRQKQIKSRATEDLVSRLVGVRDDLKRALAEEAGDVESLREGVEMTLREFDRVLGEEDVAEIDPDPGADVDPQRHEVMVRVDSDLPEGTVAEVYTPGYEMDGKVIQTAQVTVSNGEHADDADAADAESDGDAAAVDAESSGDADDTVELGGEE